MSSPDSFKKGFRFGEFEVDLEAGCLFNRGVKVRLRKQLFTILSVLLESAGKAVSREELQKRLWPGDTVVDFEIDLNTLIFRLREALGDSADLPRYIETLPKRGYRFLAPVTECRVRETASSRRVRIAVLPFTNVGGDPAEEYFSDAMTDEIITALCQTAPDQLAVIARTTAMRYKNCEKDVAQIRSELGVDYIVEGAVRRGDGRVAMNVQLVESADQTHIFAAKYDGEMPDLFNLQSRIATDIVSHIPSVSDDRAASPAREKPSEDMQAYQLYLLGRHSMYKITRDGLATARRCFEDAIARDPQFALAHDALGELFWWTSFYGFLPPKQASFSGFGAVLRALELNPGLGEAHALLGQFRQKIDYNWPEVRREMTIALELAPMSPVVRMRYAVSDLLPHAELREAVNQVEIGLEFDPLSIELQSWLSTFLWLARDYERALREARRAVSLEPGFHLPRFLIASALGGGGQHDEAVPHQRRAVELSGGAPQMLGWLGLSLARAGKADEARSILRRLEAIGSKTYVSPTCFVWVHVGLEAFDEALGWIERAIEDRDPFIIPIKTYPCLDPLRPDPRFAALVRKMNLEP